MTEIGHNGINATEAKRWLGEVARVYDELDELKIEHMNRCRAVRERLPEIYELAKDAGMPIKALKAAVKIARAEKALEHLIDKATPEDEEDQEALDYLRQIAQQGDLFDAATRKINEAIDGDDDLRPNFLKDQDAARDNAERLKKDRKSVV